jgi:hypothetical protein
MLCRGGEISIKGSELGWGGASRTKSQFDWAGKGTTKRQSRTRLLPDLGCRRGFAKGGQNTLLSTCFIFRLFLPSVFCLDQSIQSIFYLCTPDPQLSSSSPSSPWREPWLQNLSVRHCHSTLLKNFSSALCSRRPASIAKYINLDPG